MLIDLLKAGFIFLLSVCLGADDIRILQPRVAHPFPQVHYECWSYFYCHEVSAMYPLFSPLPISILKMRDSDLDSDFRFRLQSRFRIQIHIQTEWFTEIRNNPSRCNSN
jgi:hypothetical protein